MAVREYVLLALLGATGAVAPGGVQTVTQAPGTFDAGSLIQTGVGTVGDDNFRLEGELLAQCTGGDKNISGKTKTSRKTSLARRRHHGKGVTPQSYFTKKHFLKSYITKGGKRKSQPPDPLVRR